MRLVDENEVDVRPFPPGDGLDRAHLHRLVAIGARVDALQDADRANALGLEGRDRLVDQADCRHGEGDALSLVQGALDDVRGRQRLAEAGRRLQHRPPAFPRPSEARSSSRARS